MKMPFSRQRPQAEKLQQQRNVRDRSWHSASDDARHNLIIALRQELAISQISKKEQQDLLSWLRHRRDKLSLLVDALAEAMSAVESVEARDDVGTTPAAIGEDRVSATPESEQSVKPVSRLQELRSRYPEYAELVVRDLANPRVPSVHKLQLPYVPPPPRPWEPDPRFCPHCGAKSQHYRICRSCRRVRWR